MSDFLILNISSMAIAIVNLFVASSIGFVV